MQVLSLLSVVVVIHAMDFDDITLDLTTMDQATFDNFLDLDDVAMVLPSLSALPVLEVTYEQDPIKQEGCSYDYNTYSEKPFEPIDATKYMELTSGEHFLYASTIRQTAARGTFSIQSTAECVPQVIWTTQDSTRKAFGTVTPDGPVYSLLLRSAQDQRFPVSYIGDWSISRTSKQYKDQMGHDVLRTAKDGKVTLLLPTAGTDGGLCRYLLEQMAISFFSPNPDRCRIGDTKVFAN